MGLMEFVKDAGAWMFGAKAGSPVSTAEAAKTPLTVDVLKQQVQGLGIAVQDLDVALSGDYVGVRGSVATARDRDLVVLALGNTPGVAQVDDQLTVREATGQTAAPTPAEPPAKFYTVKKGDTLSAIAKAEYGAASKYPKIFEANKPMLKDPDKIYPGQVLRIPPAA